jgi:hypothetical protein
VLAQDPRDVQTGIEHTQHKYGIAVSFTIHIFEKFTQSSEKK